MDATADKILETCLARLAAGASVDDCLAAYPAQSAELDKPLRAAAGLMRLPHPAMSSHTRAALEAQLLARAAARRAASRQSRSSWRRLGPAAILAGILRALGYGGPLSAPWLRLAAAAIAIVLALLLGVGAYAAARAIFSVVTPPPAPTPVVAPTAPLATFTLDGIVEQIDEEAWVVSGAPIVIDVQTAITGSAAVGATVHIRGVIRADGARIARSIAVGPPPTAIPAVAPTPFAFPTITPAPIPTRLPAATPNDQPGDGGGDKNNQCRGQQKGRDEKKCVPKPPDKRDNKGREKDH
jgi:hypothetical protein